MIQAKNSWANLGLAVGKNFMKIILTLISACFKYQMLQVSINSGYF